MRFEQVAIEAIAYDTPPEVLSSDEIEDFLNDTYQRLRLPKGRLELMTGIQERKFYPIETLPSMISAKAGRAAMQKSRFERDEFDLVVHAAVCRDRMEPATASYIHGQLKLSPKAQIWDLSNACLGFLNAITLVGGMIESGQIERALICSGENGKSLMDWTLAELKKPEQTRKSVKPYFANLTIGAGGVAAVLCKADLAPECPRVLTGTVRTDSTSNLLCEGGSSGQGELQMLTDSEELLKTGIQLAQSTWSAFMDESGWNGNSIDRFVCHQVGSAHRRQLFESLNLDLEKDYITYPNWGNVGSVSCPLTLAKAIEDRVILPDEKVAILGIGSGLSCLMLALQF
ncbi:MAG: 3-oxoacyl-ACP synthase III [Verrucomicrobia bacterium]|nr:3-oxoacyl-ACP synthase III [Verrucomicrobiota bacterium]MDA1065777.1 3-oxoacyl-ACP synthase III [Verrucomicrobiota bacterium]